MEMEMKEPINAIIEALKLDKHSSEEKLVIVVDHLRKVSNSNISYKEENINLKEQLAKSDETKVALKKLTDALRAQINLTKEENTLKLKEETQKRWQDEISTGFDRLVAYATEVVDKRRKSSDSSSPGHLNSPSIGDQRKEIVLVSTQPSPEFDNRMSTLGVKFKGAGYRDKSGPPLMSPPGSSMTTNRIPTPNERIPTPGSTSSRAATPASSQGSRVPTPRSKSPLPGENLPEHHPKKRYFAESRMSAASSNNENLLDGRRTSNNDPYGRYYNNPGGGDPYSLPQQQQPQMMNPSTGSTR